MSVHNLLEKIVAIKDRLTHSPDEDDCDACYRYDALQGAAMAVIAEVQRLREAGAGYSQQTVDALTKERDALKVENERLREAGRGALAYFKVSHPEFHVTKMLQDALRGESSDE